MAWNALIIAFVVTVAIGDLIWRKVPRSLALIGFFAGIIYHIFRGGLFSAVSAAVIAFAIGIVFFRLGAIGGGDVKLMTALGAMLGLSQWLFAMEIAIFFAAAMALVQILRTGAFTSTLQNIGDLLRWLPRSGGREHPVINVRNHNALRAPFGVAAAVGTLCAVIRL